MFCIQGSTGIDRAVSSFYSPYALTCHSLPYLFIYFYNMPDTIHPLIGGRANYDPDSATAIVVYKVWLYGQAKFCFCNCIMVQHCSLTGIFDQWQPGSNSMPPMQNETTAHEENSKYLHISVFLIECYLLVFTFFFWLIGLYKLRPT